MSFLNSRGASYISHAGANGKIVINGNVNLSFAGNVSATGDGIHDVSFVLKTIGPIDKRA